MVEAGVVVQRERMVALAPAVPDPLESVHDERVHADPPESGRKRQSGLAAAGKTDYPGFDSTQEAIVFNMHNKDDLFLALIDHPAVLPFLLKGLDDTLVLNYFNGRSPKQGCRPQRLHLDSRIPFPSNTVMMQAIWMVDDFTLENGATRVIPGSHDEVYGHHANEEARGRMRCEVDESRAVAAVMDAGGVVFFDFGTAHATGPNPSDSDRCAATFHFLHGSCATPAVLGQAKHSTGAWISGPDALGGIPGYGTEAGSDWGRLVGRARPGV